MDAEVLAMPPSRPPPVLPAPLLPPALLAAATLPRPARRRAAEAAVPTPWLTLHANAGPGGPLRRFVEAVGDLLDAEAAAAAEGRRPAQPDLRRLGREAMKLRDRAFQQVEEIGRDALEARRVRFGLLVEAGTLAQLSLPGVLSESFTLQYDVGALRCGWQLLGGLSVASVAPSVEAIAGAARRDILEVLRRLAQEVDAAWLAVAMPQLDAVSHHLLQLDAWSSRCTLALKEELEVERWKAQEMLDASTQRECMRMRAKGFDPAGRLAAALRPAHLEHRLHWSEYRDAERAQRVAQRRATRRCAFVPRAAVAEAAATSAAQLEDAGAGASTAAGTEVTADRVSPWHRDSVVGPLLPAKPLGSPQVAVLAADRMVPPLVLPHPAALRQPEEPPTFR